MIPLRKLASALCLALLFSNSSDAQTVDPVTGLTIHSTGNVLNLGGGLPWTGTVTGGAGGTTGGNVPAYNPGTGNIIFGYTQSTVSQTVAINAALAAAGTGIQVSGYQYQWQIHNDLTNYASNRGTLTGNVSVTGATGNVLESFNYNYNQNLPSFTTFSGTQLFNNRYDTAAARNLTVSFTGHDQNVWAGYYGPRVHVDNLSLLYTIDPCKLNPAYSSTCAGFGSIINSNNLLDSTRGGGSLNQVFAVNTALGLAGSGATVHGFNYGFTYTVGQGFFGCTAWNQDGSCSWMMNTPAYVNAAVSFTNSNNQIIQQQNYSFTSEGTSGSVSEKYLLPSSMNQTLLGTGRIVGSASGTGSSISGAWANIVYTVDPCAVNPLSSASCAGYAVAYAKTLISSSTASNESTPANPGSQPQSEMSPGQGGSSGSGNDSSGNGNNSSNGNASAPSLTNILGMISNNQAKISSTEKSVVQAAESQAVQAGQQAQQQAESVAGSLTAQSIAGSMSQSGAVSGLSAPGSQSQLSSWSNSAVLISGAASSGTGLRLQTPSMIDILNSIDASVFQNTPESYGLQLPQERNAAQFAPDIPQTEGFKMGSNSALSNAIEQQFAPLSVTPEQKSETVKRDIPANDLARGVDIAAMALQPQGYSQYSVAMTDVPFYAPKEIYKNQNTVDNMRVLRQLSSDRLHQEMVNQQFKQGK